MDTPCVLAVGSRHRDGYRMASIWVGRKKYKVFQHRIAWELASGQLVPPGMKVCHRCDNPACCEPTHLFIGTHADNMQDMAQKGRSGSRTGGVRTLTATDVREMRDNYIPRDAEWGATAIAARYGVDKAHVSKILRGIKWSHIH